MTPSLAGLVLAGGRSLRMGQDKAVLRVNGRRLVDLAVQALAPICTEVLVAAGQRSIPDVRARQIADPGDGPLGGIVAGLACANSDLVAVVAVDMPAVDAGLLAALAARWGGEAAVVPRAGGFLQPLHAVYATQARAALEAAFLGGQRSPADAVVGLRALVVEVEDAGFTRNLNAPQDLVGEEPTG